MDSMVRLIPFQLEIPYWCLDYSFFIIVWDLVWLGHKFIVVMWRMSLTFASVRAGDRQDAIGEPDTWQRSYVFIFFSCCTRISVLAQIITNQLCYKKGKRHSDKLGVMCICTF